MCIINMRDLKPSKPLCHLWPLASYIYIYIYIHNTWKTSYSTWNMIFLYNTQYHICAKPCAICGPWHQVVRQQQFAASTRRPWRHRYEPPAPRLIPRHTYIHTYIHTCTHTCIHECIHTCMHACIHAYMHTYMHTCTLIYIQTYIHTNVHASMHAYIHAYVYEYIHSYTHACTHMHVHTHTHTHTHQTKLGVKLQTNANHAQGSLTRSRACALPIGRKGGTSESSVTSEWKTKLHTR